MTEQDQGPDGPRAAPGEVQADGRIMTADVGGMPGYPVAHGTLWVTRAQAEQAMAHGWLRVPLAEHGDDLVQVTR